jgi:hypothetical protein
VNWLESHVAGPFDLSIAPNALGLFIGDYHALTSIGTTFVPLFVQTNNGNLANRTDVFATLVNSAGTATKAAAASASGRGVPVLAQTASPFAMTPDLAQRLQLAAQRMLERRRSEHGGSASAN